MKYLLIISLLNICYWVKGQTYSKVISDSIIIDIINKDILRDSLSSPRLVNVKFWKPDLNTFYYFDSADLVSKRNDQFSLFKYIKMKTGLVISNYIDTLFSRDDIDYFKEQIESLRKRERWRKPFVNTRLIDMSTLDSPFYPEKIIYTYSIPIFTRNNQYAILIKGFYCGIVCGGGAYYLYQRDADDWKLIKEMNVWAE